MVILTNQTMKAIIKYNILTFLAVLLVGFSYGQDVTFTAAASHDVVKTGDRFKIQFSSNTELSNFKAPKLSNFRVLSGPNQSTQMSWVNGKTSSSISYTYVLMAVKEGVFTIGPAVAVANGKAIKTNSLKITVGKGVKVQQGNNQSKSQTKSGGSASDELFIRSTVTRKKVYQGEQIKIHPQTDKKIYTKYQSIKQKEKFDTLIKVNLKKVFYGKDIVSKNFSPFFDDSYEELKEIELRTNKKPSSFRKDACS